MRDSNYRGLSSARVDAAKCSTRAFDGSIALAASDALPLELRCRAAVPTILKKWASKLSPPSKALRAAYRAAWTDAQCVAWGRRTSAKQVLRQAEKWLGPAASALQRGAEAAYSLRRVAYLAELCAQLEDTVLGATPEVLDRTDLEALMARAKKARTRTLQRARLMVGGDAVRAAQLARISGTPRDVSAMAKFLDGAAKVIAEWRDDELGEVLADDIGLDAASVTELEELAVALQDEGLPFMGVPQREGDAPVTNVLEGRVLRELRMLQLSFVDARKNRQDVPPLRVLAGLKGLLDPKSKPSRGQ